MYTLLHKHKLIFGSLCSLAAVCLSGCASESPDMPGQEAGNGEILSISALGFNNSNATRAANTNATGEGDGIKYTEYNPVTEDNELIKNWVVYLISESGNVIKLSSSDSWNNGGDYTEGVDKSVVNGEYGIVAKNYKVYGFANFDPFEGAGNLTYDSAPIQYDEFKDLNWGKWSGTSDSPAYFADDTKIPMAGYLDIDSPQKDGSYQIQVVRLLAKMEFAFTNKAGYQIDVNSVTVSPVYSGDIYVMPDYDELKNDEKTPDFASINDNDNDYHSAEITHNVGVNLVNNETWRTHFYLKETSSKHPTSKYLIAINLTRHIGEETKDDTLYALVEDMEYLYRNDYVLIPITFTDYIPMIEIRSYPPIGGYPANVLEENDNEYYATFYNSERFEVYPYLMQASTGLPVSDDDYTVSVEYDHENPIFDNLLKDGQQNVYVGDLNSDEGEAKVTVTFEYTGDNQNITYKSQRIVHIIRTNKN